MRDRYLRQRAYRERQKREMDNRGYYPEYDYRNDYMPRRNGYKYEDDYMETERFGKRDRGYDYTMRDRYRGDYHDDDYEKEYERDLQKWTEKLKKYDRFGLPKEKVIENARQMGVKFKDFDEDEFYAVYLMQVSDYPTISNDARMYLGMAKSWLEDEDLKIDPSEKVCKYMYEIVMADED